MSNPRPESRIKSLEKRATDIEADIEELAGDTAEEFKALRQSNKELFEHVQKGFDQAHAFVQERLNEIKGDITEIKATMATKDDIRKFETRLDRHENLLEQILNRLPPKP